MSSALEKQFLFRWKLAGGPKLTPEHQFHGARLWRFDFALPEMKIAFEIEGGIWVKGRHVRGSGMVEDCHKYLAAALLGWQVIRLVEPQLNLDTVRDIVAYVKGRGRA
ncbi:hypothetical protein SAMN05444156_3244 [Verrucomicrobium sp. GAS474]|uniref:hypothetical protein n=1 Tax=Verrucomicrobium sp. GAS474 TaxID=1882831 RepID=UPI00087D5288|nr:hypothetical protein [Verrucomicrobium sp. GAS474]SDT85634.1 hypothetical protein SAMN05444156_0006 [Verrucomicrobium sp. GAS474]SDU31492.1 hypothetical protein SAMN05444156_3244 [Verrucomicrobium sp. GAS474]